MKTEPQHHGDGNGRGGKQAKPSPDEWQGKDIGPLVASEGDPAIAELARQRKLQERVEQAKTAIPELAAKTALEYGLVRKEYAAKLGLTLDVLDAEVKAARPAKDSIGGEDTTERLLAIVKERCELFHTLDRVGYADFVVEGEHGPHRETWPLESPDFTYLLRNEFMERTGRIPKPSELKGVINTLVAKAISPRSPVREVYVRIAPLRDRTYLDLVDDDWRVVEISAAGRKVIDASPNPVRFVRYADMHALPEPVPCADAKDRKERIADLLATFFPRLSEHDRILILSVILTGIRGKAPLPVLNLVGPAGSAKSTETKYARRLFDPSKHDLRGPPRNDREFVTTLHSYVQAYDNLSTLSASMSDAICRFSDGRGDLTRKLFTTSDAESIRGGGRLFMLTSIASMVTKPDLNDRTVTIVKDKLRDEHREYEEVLAEKFEAEHARYLGALLDIVAHGFKQLPKVKLHPKPRRADFARWATACEEAYADAGAFMRAFETNRDEAIEKLLDQNAVAQAVIALGLKRQSQGSDVTWKGGKWSGDKDPDITWTGTATQLLAMLKQIATNDEQKLKDWPKSPSHLSNQLNGAAPLMKGVYVTRDRQPASRKLMIAWTAAGLKHAQARQKAEKGS